MVVVTRFILLCAVLLALPTITAAQPEALAVQRVWTQDAAGKEKITFIPGETIQFAAQLNNPYDKAIPSVQLTIITSFYNNTKTVNISPGISTSIWSTAVPFEQSDTVTIQAYDRLSDSWAVGSRSFSVTSIDNKVTTQDRYNPSQFGISETIGGYSVFAVLTEDNFLCIKPGEQRLVLQSPEPTIEDGPRDFPNALIEQELQTAGFTEPTQWEWSIVGPGVPKEQIIYELDQSYRFLKAHGCPTHKIPLPNALTAPDSGCPLISGDDLNGGERRCIKSSPGFAIIQNRDSDLGKPNTNAQSVIFIAPSVGNNQKLWFSDCDWSKCDWNKWPPCSKVCLFKGSYSALLNNVMTDKHYFLQVGLHFTNRPSLREPFHNPPLPDPPDCPSLPISDPGNPFSPDGIGTVVFAGAQIDENGDIVSGDLHARALCVPYIAGHHYYTTISRSMEGPWWTCAADMQNPSTYRCRHHPLASGTHIITHMQGTNVFAENWNKKASWHVGFPYQWVAYGARTYVDGIGYPWSNEAKWTQHSCDDKRWPPEEAIVANRGFTQLDGYAFFNTGYLPLHCK